MPNAPSLLQIAALTLASSLLAPICPGQTADETKREADQFSQRLTAITRSPASAERVASVATLLEKMDVEFKLIPFKSEGKNGKSGKNLIVDLGDNSKPQILIGAHFDQVNVGNGAVDNASGCGLMIELIERFGQQRLSNHHLRCLLYTSDAADE